MLIGVHTTASGVKTTAPWIQNYCPLESKLLTPGVIFWGPEMLPEDVQTFLKKMESIGSNRISRCNLLQIMVFGWSIPLSYLKT